MQRQGLVQAFRQTAGRRLVPILQLMLERLEGGEGLVVLRTVVGALETLPPHRLLKVRAWPGNSPRSRACAIDTVAPGRGGGRPSARTRPEPLAAIYDHQKPLGNIEAPLDQGPEERGQHLGSRCPPTKPRNRFVPRHRDAQRDDHRRLGERLAVQHEGHNVLAPERSRWSSYGVSSRSA